jgi:Spy/CpxP family protein refolding chaperone
MKRILVLISITLVAAVSAIAAEGPGPRPREERGAELGRYLNLTAEQRTVWDAAHADFAAAAEPLFEKERGIMEQVEASLKSKSDACGIGNNMLAAQAVRDQIHAARETMTQKQLAVLTPEQKTRFEAFFAARGGPEGEMMKRRHP